MIACAHVGDNHLYLVIALLWTPSCQINKDIADFSRRAKSDYALATDKEAALRLPGRSASRCCLLLQVRGCPLPLCSLSLRLRVLQDHNPSCKLLLSGFLL